MFPELGMKGLCGDNVEELKMAEERKIPEGCLGLGGRGEHWNGSSRPGSIWGAGHRAVRAFVFV